MNVPSPLLPSISSRSVPFLPHGSLVAATRHIAAVQALSGSWLNMAGIAVAHYHAWSPFRQHPQTTREVIDWLNKPWLDGTRIPRLLCRMTSGDYGDERARLRRLSSSRAVVMRGYSFAS